MVFGLWSLCGVCGHCYAWPLVCLAYGLCGHCYMGFLVSYLCLLVTVVVMASVAVVVSFLVGLGFLVSVVFC